MKEFNINGAVVQCYPLSAAQRIHNYTIKFSAHQVLNIGTGFYIQHDIDFEMWPDEHCKKCVELLEGIGATPEFIHAVCSHAWGPCSDVEPVHEMEKVLFATDELTGLIGATALMRPSKSVQDMELKSLKKKYKSKGFAAGCSREVIEQGAEMLGWPLDDVLQKTLDAMKACEAQVASGI